MPDYDISSDSLGLVFTFTNHSDSDIRAFTGTIFFFDLFDREQLGIALTVDSTPLRAGSTTRDDSWSFELNMFMPEHKWVATRKLTDMKAVFVTTAILFSDGRQLGL